MGEPASHARYLSPVEAVARIRKNLILGTQMHPILFWTGVSGSGKSTLAAAVAKHLKLLFLEIDLWGTDGVDFHRLRTEWDEFWLSTNPANLAAALRERAVRTNADGAVASFPSNAIFTVQHIQAAEASGIHVVITHGSRDSCLGAFLSREKEIGRHLDENHWRRFNSPTHDT